jgi:membrane protease YdiL (CAAX protease family)
LYLVLYQVFAKVFISLVPKSLGSLSALFLAAYVTYPFILRVYRKVPVLRAEKQFARDDLKRDFIFLISIVLVGVVLNVIISHTPLVEISEAYKAANTELFDGPLWVKILTTCVMIPILEETLFRGIIALQFDLWLDNKWIAVILSALLFGAVHFNIVQLVYAFSLGILLGLCIVKTHKLWLCILSHGLLNLVVVIVTTIGG